jgi:hypothetical protein
MRDITEGGLTMACNDNEAAHLIGEQSGYVRSIYNRFPLAFQSLGNHFEKLLQGTQPDNLKMREFGEVIAVTLDALDRSQTDTD